MSGYFNEEFLREKDWIDQLTGIEIIKCGQAFKRHAPEIKRFIERWLESPTCDALCQLELAASRDREHLLSGVTRYSGVARTWWEPFTRSLRPSDVHSAANYNNRGKSVKPREGGAYAPRIPLSAGRQQSPAEDFYGQKNCSFSR